MLMMKTCGDPGTYVRLRRPLAEQPDVVHAPLRERVVVEAAVARQQGRARDDLAEQEGARNWVRQY